MKRVTGKSYRLADQRLGESCIIKSGRRGSMTVYDPEKKVRRAIRHCPNQASIFVDEQDEYALVEPIIFTHGLLDVKGDQPMTIAFLDAHPSNVANGGGWFEEINDEIEAKESIRDEELKTDVITAIREVSREDGGLQKMSAVVAVLLNSVEDASTMKMEELKRVLYGEVEANVEYFVDEEGNVTIFEDDDIYRKYIVLSAIREGILKKSANGKSMLWARDNKLIATAPMSVDLVEFFSDFLTTDEGILVLEEIERRS